MRGVSVLTMCALVGAVAASPVYAAAATPSPEPATTGADPGAVLAAGAAVMVMQRVCLPVIGGAGFEGVVRSAGLENRHGQWVYPIDRRQRIEVSTPDPSNPHVCNATIIHDVGAQPAIRQALDNWARSRTPPLQAIKVQVQAPGPFYLRKTSTWSGSGPGGEIGVVFSGEKTLQGQPVDGDLDQSELLASVTPVAS